MQSVMCTVQCVGCSFLHAKNEDLQLKQDESNKNFISRDTFSKNNTLVYFIKAVLEYTFSKIEIKKLF